MTAVKVLLWLSIFIGPVVTGAFWMWSGLAHPADGMADLGNFLLVLGSGVISFSAAFWLGALAILIQLWRNQWHRRLTVVATGMLFVFFVVYCWEMIGR